MRIPLKLFSNHYATKLFVNKLFKNFALHLISMEYIIQDPYHHQEKQMLFSSRLTLAADLFI